LIDFGPCQITLLTELCVHSRPIVNPSPLVELYAHLSSASVLAPEWL